MGATGSLTVAALNGYGRDDFVAALEGIFEHSPWIAAAALKARPFGSLDDLHTALCAVVKDSGSERQLALIRAHPELARLKGDGGELTAESTGEQRSVGLDRLTIDLGRRLEAANAAYRQRFGQPCIVCVREHSGPAAIVAAIERRIDAAADEEHARNLDEIFKIVRLRLLDRLVTGSVSTHVLDTARGIPAGGVKITVALAYDGDRWPLKTVVTNGDGRTDEPLLGQAEMRACRLELRFAVGAYFAASGVPTADPPYLDEIPIAVNLSDAAAHYHVPLLASPWSYSTYRGS